MRREEKITKIVMDVYSEMYKSAQPSADIYEIMKSGEGKEEGFFNKYYLSMEDQERIISTELAKHKLKSYEKIKISRYFWGSSPCSNKETVNKYREELGLEAI